MKMPCSFFYSPPQTNGGAGEGQWMYYSGLTSGGLLLVDEVCHELLEQVQPLQLDTD